MESGVRGDSNVPASDVVKVHTYRRRGTPAQHDRDSTLMYDRAQVKGGDVLVGKSVAPESGSRSTDRNANDNGDSGVSTGVGEW